MKTLSCLGGILQHSTPRVPPDPREGSTESHLKGVALTGGLSPLYHSSSLSATHISFSFFRSFSCSFSGSLLLPEINASNIYFFVFNENVFKTNAVNGRG